MQQLKQEKWFSWKSGSITGKLSDCASKIPEECEVYLVEEIQQVEQQNKEEIDISVLCHLEVRS